jgi:cobalamin-dependent methionine synthase I
VRRSGKRYSFGYPAWPNLEDQAGIWKLLRPEEIGVQLTEGFMTDPEARVSAQVFQHPHGVYFLWATASTASYLDGILKGRRHGLLGGL